MKTITFKVTEDEARAIRAKARQERITLSEYLRRRATNRSARPAKPRLIRCLKTGAMIFAPLADEPAFTTETVRQLLADFP
jgi:hypothetical protein